MKARANTQNHQQKPIVADVPSLSSWYSGIPKKSGGTTPSSMGLSSTSLECTRKEKHVIQHILSGLLLWIAWRVLYVGVFLKSLENSGFHQCYPITVSSPPTNHDPNRQDKRKLQLDTNFYACQACPGRGKKWFWWNSARSPTSYCNQSDFNILSQVCFVIWTLHQGEYWNWNHGPPQLNSESWNLYILQYLFNHFIHTNTTQHTT